MAKDEDDRRAKSIERAKAGGKALVGLGLNALLPGSGSLVVRLGEHVAGLIYDDRIARLDDFHQRVFEGDLSEQEINDRFKAMEDVDFRHLLNGMLTDIEAEKVAIYSAVYIYLVENNERLEQFEKRMWVLAVSQLSVKDLLILRIIINDGIVWTGTGPSQQKLVMVGAAEMDVQLQRADSPPGSSALGSEGDRAFQTTVETEFGKELLAVIDRHLPSTES